MATKQTLSRQLTEQTGVNSAKCYQCGKCSAGCPLAEEMDLTSSSVMRMLQVEEETSDHELLQSQAIWLCVSCEMCISRCPMKIDIPKAMDFLRQKSLASGLQNKSADHRIIAFHRSFLDMIRFTGRSYEIGLVVDYKLRSKKFLQDIALAPKMFAKGKLPIIPETVKDKQNISNIFNKLRIKS